MFLNRFSYFFLCWQERLHAAKPLRSLSLLGLQSYKEHEKCGFIHVKRENVEFQGLASHSSWYNPVV